MSAGDNLSQEVRIEEPDGRIGHMTLRLGPALLFLADEHPEFERVIGPAALGGTSVTLDLEVDDVDGAVAGAVDAGASLVGPPDHPSSGVQAAKVRDPFGHVWPITHVVAASSG